MARTLRAIAILAALITLGATQGAMASEGSVRFFKRTGPSFDQYTNSTDAGVRTWINSKMTRMLVFSPYFDQKTSWYADGWLYKDLYAIYRDSDTAREHPEWILRDANGQPLYIPWGCSNGTCPQYAGDITNTEFRRHIVEDTTATLERGYRGVWVDDVNLEFRVGNGNGAEVAPIDPRTGTTMTWTAWRAAMASFVEELDQDVPSTKEIVHNSIWYAAPTRQADPYVRRQIAASDLVNLERGVNDDGITGDTGSWSLQSFLGFVDTVHSMGKGVVLDAYDSSATGREYSLASYYLISTGLDYLGESSATPTNWWSGWDTQLGAARGARTVSAGVHRREFERGLVLVNEPGAATRTITLASEMLAVNGTRVSAVRLDGGRGAILRHISGAIGGSKGDSKGSKGSTPLADSATPMTFTARTVRPRLSQRGRVVVVSGRFNRSVQANIKLQRRQRGAWKTVRRCTVDISESGRFEARFAPLRHARYRAVARISLM